VGYFVGLDAKEKILALQRREFLEEDLPVIKQKMRQLGISIDELTLDDVI
jgi:ribosome assembly protein YihI (activator of Der GTPase)